MTFLEVILLLTLFRSLSVLEYVNCAFCEVSSFGVDCRQPDPRDGLPMVLPVYETLLFGVTKYWSGVTIVSFIGVDTGVKLIVPVVKEA